MKIEVINDPDFFVWETFRDTVEGKPSEFSVKLTPDRIDIIREPIAPEAKSQEELVAQLLRSKIPLTQAARNMLADMLDSKASTAFFFKFDRRKAGRHPPWGKWHPEAVQYCWNLMGEGVPEKAAKMDAAKKFKIGLKSLENSLKKARDQRAAYAKFAARFSDAN
jgi:hypothetical protein